MTMLIRDGQRLAAAFTRHDNPIPVYDDRFGPLWLFGDSSDIIAIVRAQTYEDAHEICEDEFYPEANEATWADLARECDYTGAPDGLIDDAIFQENYGFRPNGRNATDQHGHGVYQKDLNGNWLSELSAARAAELGLRVVVEDEATETEETE